MPVTRTKRTPIHAPIKVNEIYVKSSSNFQSLLARAVRLIDTPDILHTNTSGKQESNIHKSVEKERSFTINGLGKTIVKVVQLVNAVQKRRPGACAVTLTTSSVDVLDDVEENPDEIGKVSKRSVTSIKATFIVM